MGSASEFLLYVFVGGPLLIVGVYALIFVIAIGPLGWFLLGFLVIAGIATGRHWASGDETVERTNCAACGAPNAVDAETCGYCEASLDAA